MPVLHMSRCCVLRRLILRLQPGRALNHDVPRAPEQGGGKSRVISEMGA